MESGEESGSPDLVSLLINLKDRIGNPDLIICTDSGYKDYSSPWLTPSLHGVADFELEIDCIKEDVHYGEGSGITLDALNILRILLDRLEDSKTSKVITSKHLNSTI